MSRGNVPSDPRVFGQHITQLIPLEARSVASGITELAGHIRRQQEQITGLRKGIARMERMAQSAQAYGFYMHGTQSIYVRQIIDEARRLRRESP